MDNNITPKMSFFKRIKDPIALKILLFAFLFFIFSKIIVKLANFLNLSSIDLVFLCLFFASYTTFVMLVIYFILFLIKPGLIKKDFFKSVFIFFIKVFIIFILIIGFFSSFMG